MAVAPEREEEPVFDLRVLLKIAGNEIDIAVLLRRNSELVEYAVRGALEVISGLFVANIATGSIIVELLCTTRESFLTFMEDFKANNVKQRLNEEFRKIGHNEELEVTIANNREVYEKLEQIRHTIQGAISNVQNAWNTFAERKFSEVKQAALETYVALLTSQLSDVLPCDNDTIRVCHNAALKESLGQFMTEVNGFSTNKVELHARELKVSIEKKLKSWQTENERRTRKLCKELFEKLKKRHLDPVLQQLQGNAGAKLSYDDIIGGYKRLKDDYEKKAKGAKDVIAAVFFDYHEELKKEEERNMTWLKKLKSFDEEKGRRLAAEACQAKEIKRLEEQMARLLQESQKQKNEMELLIKNLHEEEKRFTEQMEDERKNQQEELKNMMAAIQTGRKPRKKEKRS